MNNKNAIIGVLVLTAVFGALGAGAYFFAKPMFDQYKEDERLRQSLEQTLTSLRDNFQGYVPDLLINGWQEKMQPWRDARTERSAYFSFGDWFDTEKPPVEARLRKFWYVEVTNKAIQDFWTEVYAKTRSYETFPQDVRKLFGVAAEQDWQGRDVTDAEIERNMFQLSFGLSACRFFLKNNVTQMSNMSIWPRRTAKEYGDMLAMQTLGAQLTIPARDLVKMFEELRMADRYFSVDGMKITYPYIAYNVEPQLQVQMLLTQANYRKQFVEGSDKADAAAPGAPGAPGAAPAGFAALQRPTDVQREPVAEPGAIGKAWKWFKRTVLVMH
ncbi:MAG: hypothetical protein GXY15_03030 [Candidatus Hydrogenedentes bacterium]|nr:hypothetical protein [Candidatus Hydrogenedentota bacterium]